MSEEQVPKVRPKNSTRMRSIKRHPQQPGVSPVSSDAPILKIPTSEKAEKMLQLARDKALKDPVD